ncbi:FAD binding domain-containing protein [Halofilum ochraceum]|uniref:FAD binding domain-containing protein n=1 Tax=Halofilum ochraceum TaxID=1611323 RepID=UPI0008379A6D|nr:xanthine dehydrogenase family protein subunit M [Halofilum ochraceum]
MYAFGYHRPTTIDEAVKLLGQSEDASAIAGGQTLLQSLKQRLAQPADLIDLGAIKELSGITVDGKTVVIGALTRHNEVALSPEVQKAIPALADLAGAIGDHQVRNVGTIGGSVANSDPAADYPAAVLGLGATIETNQRRIAADDFFIDLFETALEPGELIKAIHFPGPKRAAYVKFPQPASRYALVGVMVAETGDGVRVAVTGAGACAFRVPAMEQALAGDFSADAIKGVQVDADELNDDIHGTPAYRAHLVNVLARRAVEAAR